jgi:hypothetical protein
MYKVDVLTDMPNLWFFKKNFEKRVFMTPTYVYVNFRLPLYINKVFRPLDFVHILLGYNLIVKIP